MCKKEIPHVPGFYEKYMKHLQDFYCVLLSIIILLPVMPNDSYTGAAG